MHLPIYVVFLFIVLFNFTSAVSRHQLTIVISFDAFWYKYLERNVTPTLSKLRDEGSRAKYMMNIFPTKTYPNHFSIATGRYAEEHGVLENVIFDPVLNKKLSYSEELFTFNKTILPIWTLNEKAGAGRHSGVMMWPGGEFKYKGTLPTFNKAFDYNMPFKSRVDEALTWIIHPKTPANLVFLYFEEPDTQGHVYGPDSQNVSHILKKDDETLKYLMDKLEVHHILNYNLILLSDHGMAGVPFKNIIDLNETIPLDLYDYYGSSPTLEIFPKKDKEKDVESILREAANKNGSHFNFFLKEEIPDDWHYKHSPRTPPMFLLADNGYVFSDIYKTLDYYKEKLNITFGPNSTFGAHGYNRSDDNMHPFFIAFGPSFKSNYTIDEFENVDLYSLFAGILDIDILPDSHSGNFSRVKGMLSYFSPTVSSASTAKTVFLVVAMFFCLAVVVTTVLIISVRCINIPSTMKWERQNHRRQSLYDVEYTALEDCHLLTVFSESDEAT